jgi:hypothetical protein
MIEIALAVVMLVSSAEVSSALESSHPRPTLQLPVDLVSEPSLPIWRLESPRVTQATAAKRPSTAAKIIGTALGGLGGFYAGGAIGFYVAQDRDVYDDGVSGLRGVVIGAPIGAALGALLGYKLVR